MTRFRCLISLRLNCLIAAGLGLAVILHSADWSQWRGPQRDGHVTAGDPLPRRLASEPSVVWRIPAGPGLASPVIASGKVFVFDAQDGQETLRALDRSSGKELWRQAIDAPFTDSQSLPGPRCTPVVDGDRMYAVSCRGELQCRRATDGHPIWRTSYTADLSAVFIGEKGATPGAGRHGNNGAPLIDGDRLVACVGSINGASVVAFEKRTGKVLWKSQNDIAGYAPPLVATLAGVRQYICFTAEGVIGLECDSGRLLWRYGMKTSFGRHAVTPVIAGDRVIVSTHQAGVIALQIRSAPAGQSVEGVWTNREAAMNFSSPIRVNQTLYGLGPARNLVALDVSTGQIGWSQDGWFTSPKDKAYAGFLTDGSTVLVLTDGGEIGLFSGDPGSWKELGRAQISGSNWCNPAWSEGHLILRDAKSWICLNLGH